MHSKYFYTEINKFLLIGLDWFRNDQVRYDRVGSDRVKNDRVRNDRVKNDMGLEIIGLEMIVNRYVYVVMYKDLINKFYIVCVNVFCIG